MSAVNAERSITVTFSGGVQGTQEVEAAANAASPGQVEVKTLASGANTITAPSVSGVTPTGLTIIPPAGNTQTLTLKGVTGDTGVPLHKTDPTSISLETTFVSLCLTAGASGIVGVRLIWS